jgi:hypothetical protein
VNDVEVYARGHYCITAHRTTKQTAGYAVQTAFGWAIPLRTLPGGRVRQIVAATREDAADLLRLITAGPRRTA